MRRRTPWLTYLTVLVLVSCQEKSSPTPESGVGEQRQRSGLDEYDYIADPNLSAEQKEMLTELAAWSASNGSVMVVEPWSAAGTIQRLDLEVAVGSEGDDRIKRVQSFLATYGALWKLDLSQVEIVTEIEDDDCSTVVVQRYENGKPIFNATLSFVVSSEGVIRSVMGRMTGGGIGDPAGAAIPEAEAVELFMGTYGVPTGFEPEPVEALFSPFFATDSRSAPSLAWVFNGWTTGGDVNFRSPVVIGGNPTTGATITFQGPTFSGNRGTDIGWKCDVIDRTPPVSG